MTKLWIRHFTIEMFLILFLFSAACRAVPPEHVYIGQISASSVLLAWGTTAGHGNTIGRDSTPLGKAEVKIAGRILPATHNWLEVNGLQPDTSYPYEVVVNGRSIGSGTVRTYPAKADSLAFFVIGDFGTGGQPQYRVAAAMDKEFEKRRNSKNPVRFVITTGDNIYADVPKPVASHSGAADADWESKFFRPYSNLLAAIPFYPTLGNHDGNESEKQGDLPAYLDNFYFPGNKPARYYQFQFGGLVDFFALDATKNTLPGTGKLVYAPGGEQHLWLTNALAESKAPWKIPYFHEPPYTAGPFHGPSRNQLSHFVDLFKQHGVAAVFNGHEHNFQISDPSKTGGITYVISGAGGELRSGDISAKLAKAGMKAFAAQHHFLVVEIQGKRMEITPVNGDGKPIGKYEVTLPSSDIR